MVVEVKQAGTPDIGVPMGKVPRTCFRLQPGDKHPLYWDHAGLDTCVVLRPAFRNGVTYRWSGPVRINAEERYRPIRIHPEYSEG